MTYASASNNQWITYTNIVEALSSSYLELNPGQTISSSNRYINKGDLVSIIQVDLTNSYLVSKTYSTQFIAKQDITPRICICPTGFTHNADNTLCVKVTTVSASLVGGGSLNTLQHYSLNEYTRWGSLIYPLGSYNSDGSINTLIDTTLIDTTSPLFGFKPSGEPSIINNLWRNPYTGTLQDGTNGRLNRCGVWKQGSPTYNSTDIGFSRSINIPISGNYFIGVGSDDYCTIRVNGNIIIQQNLANIRNSINTLYAGGGIVSSTADLFRYWHLYEIYLSAGTNIISLSGTNTFSSGIIGCEVYNATSTDLKNCNNETDLSPYIIFSSAPTPFGGIDTGDTSDVGYYDCSGHPGYTLSYDPNTNSYSCTLVETSACIV